MGKPSGVRGKASAAVPGPHADTWRGLLDLDLVVEAASLADQEAGPGPSPGPPVSGRGDLSARKVHEMTYGLIEFGQELDSQLPLLDVATDG